MAQAPATVLQEINGLYVALYDRAADNQGINFWAGQLGMSAAQAATTPITTAQATLLGQQFVTTQATYFLATYASLNDIQFVEALYGNIGGNAGDPTGIQYWLGQLQTAEAGGANAQAARAGIVGQFVDQMLSVDLTLGAAALGLSPAQYADAQARQTELQNKIAVSQFYANESALPGGSILATPSTTAPAFQAAIDVIAGVTNDAATVVAAENAIVAAVATQNLAPILALLTAPTQPNQTFTLTTGQDTFAGTGFDVFNAPLSASGTATLTSFDSLVSTPIVFPPGSTPPISSNFSVLNANFSGTPSPQQPGSLNIRGIPIWNIGQDLGSSSSSGSQIILTGDAAGGPSIISGLQTLNFSDDETNGSLIIGDNSSPVYEPNGVNNFTIVVNSAVGTGYNGVDVDLAASAFTGHDTINVTANVVGGFATSNGSYDIPREINVEPNNGDTYDPNWLGYLHDEFSIGAGASAGLPGAIGFQTWNINSIGAKAVGTLNIIGLSGEGSTTANFINLSDDGSNTMLFANAISDGLSTDWQNVKTVDLSKTSGFVTITGLETNVASTRFDGGNGSSSFTAAVFASAFQSQGGGGLLASDTTALTSIVGGAGNSFYDLSSLTPAAAHAGTWDGGHSTAGNSEIAFNNAVMTSGLSVTLTHISILDDISSISALTLPSGAILENDGEAQGGVIDMANFSGLLPLNTPYALLAEDLQHNGGLGVLPPPGLPFTAPQFLFTPPTQALPPTVTAQHALDLQNGVVPAGFQLLQLLNAEGSTQTVLGDNLKILDGFTNFAVNMQDTADGWLTTGPDFSLSVGNDSDGIATFTHTFSTGSLNGFNITFVDTSPTATINTGDTLDWFVSDDGASISSFFVSLTVSGSSGVSVSSTAFNAPVVTIDNYTTVNIVLPFESNQPSDDTQGFDYAQNYTVLGSTAFIDQPVVSVGNASLNFFDNHADNGGSPPGGPTNLVLGHTNFTDLLLPSDIGVTTVVIDAFAATGIDPLTINDFGTGSFEIGATNATNLNAQSTSHLIMDLPGTNTLFGINVNGSLTGQNLLQGTSGPVFYDLFGHNGSGGQAVSIFSASFGINGFGVYEAFNSALNPGWGNDTLTGGAGWGSASTSTVGGVTFTSFSLGVSNSSIDGLAFFDNNGNPTGPGPGNTGDNFFGEGGTDVINISATEQGKLTSFQDVTSSSGTVLVASSSGYENDSTVWVGFYDVCNSAGPWAVFNNLGAPASGIGGVLNQAITDLDATLSSSGTGEHFVDGYGGAKTLVTINGFHLGPQSAVKGGLGDTIVFGAADWAQGQVGGFVQEVFGLTQSDGATHVNATGSQLFGQAATYVQVGTANTQLTLTADVILDSIAPVYANAAALQNALLTPAQGNIILAGAGVDGSTTVDILIAYNTPTGINIADLTLANFTGAPLTDTSAFHGNTGTLQVHDLVHINTVLGLGSLDTHNIWFTA